MTAALAPTLLGLVAARFAWPGALEVDGKALAALPEPERPAAVERLVERYGVPAAAPYLAPLLGGGEPEVRVYVGRLLAGAGDPRALATAVDWLTAPGRSPADRAFGLDLLGRAPTLDPAARRALEQACRDHDASVRMRALEALGRQEVSSSLAAVLGALDDDSREVRLQAVLTTARAAGQDPDQATLATLPLIERLEDADRLIRLAALRALGRLHDPRAVRALVRIASEQTIDLRVAAVDALGAPAMAEAVPALIRFARREPTDDVARHADLALGEIGTPAAIAALAARLRTPPVSDEVKLGLRHAGGAAVEALARELAHGTPASAALAAELLGELGDRRATAALARAVDAAPEDATLVLVAIDALARLRDPAGVPALARAAAAPYADVRLRALTALTAIADGRSVAVLPAGLADPDARVRAAAAELAGAAAARAAAPALADRLGDADGSVRRAAAQALARLGSVPGNLARMLAVLAATRPTRQEDEIEALGDALEANAAAATTADAAQLDAAFARADSALQIALGRALAAVRAGKTLTDRAAIEAALGRLPAGGAGARTAADVLAVARLSDADAVRLARAFADAEPVGKARLCAAIARAPHGDRWLAALIDDPREALAVRAAAAWSARGLSGARASLERAAHGGDPLAFNARAALAAGGRAGGWSGLRLLAPDGTPLCGRWVTLTVGDLSVQAMTDETGRARVDGLVAPASGAWSAPGLSLRDAP